LFPGAGHPIGPPFDDRFHFRVRNSGLSAEEIFRPPIPNTWLRQCILERFSQRFTFHP
jgi:hypothetical protein